jgi:hypothetical protein
MATESSTTLKSWLGMNIPNLNDNNYRIWKALIGEILLARDLMGYVDGGLAEPREDDKDGLKKWKQGNATASAMIKGALTAGQLNHVVGTLNAKKVWDTLKTIHEANNEAGVQSLLNEFIRFRIETTIDEGASRLNRIQQEISNLDEQAKPSDKIKIKTLLCGLGPVPTENPKAGVLHQHFAISQQLNKHQSLNTTEDLVHDERVIRRVKGLA